jgi:toxin FitB
MKILDTNILIYSGESAHSSLLLPYVTNKDYAFSAISKVETLGFSKITAAQIRYFDTIFLLLNALPVTDNIIEKAIQLKQQRKMTLGDALIAATALINNKILVTRNTSDFDWINGLVLENPFVIIH